VTRARVLFSPLCLVVLLAVGALAVTGCGSKKLDTGAVEQNIIDRVDKRKVPIERVTCPDDVDAEEGRDFRCTAYLSGGKEAIVNVSQKDDNGTVEYQFQLPPGFKIDGFDVGGSSGTKK
jgi:hypothetical protein